MIRLLIISTLIVTIIGCCGSDCNDHHKSHWGYKGETGPQHWGDLQAEYSACKNGKKQSPIDIVTNGMKKGMTAQPISLDYQVVGLDIVNNGHTIQCNYPQGSTLKIGDQTYQLLQFHFHHPSEHTVNGAYYGMEMHLVHKNAEGEIGVLGLLIREGRESEFLAQLWKYAPKKADQSLVNAEIKVDVRQILPAQLGYYNYSGSLTTPPCSEAVNWMVLKNVAEASKEQIAAFKALMGGPNNRPVQRLHARVVTEY